jgi:hypothetical protein
VRHEDGDGQAVYPVRPEGQETFGSVEANGSVHTKHYNHLQQAGQARAYVQAAITF